MNLNKFEMDTEFEYVSLKLPGLLGEIVAYVESLGLCVVKASGDKYKYRIMHLEIGCLGSFKLGKDAVLFLDKDSIEHTVDNVNAFAVALADAHSSMPLTKFIAIVSDTVAVTMDQSNDHVKSLVQLIMYLILQKGLSMRVSQVVSHEQLMHIGNYNNTKSFIVFKDRVVDMNGSEVRNELDVLLYL